MKKCYSRVSHELVFNCALYSLAYQYEHRYYNKLLYELFPLMLMICMRFPISVDTCSLVLPYAQLTHYSSHTVQ